MKELSIKKSHPVILKTIEEINVTEYIRDIVLRDNLKVLAYNICRDHVHLILLCKPDSLTGIVQKIKAISAKKFNISRGVTRPGQGVMTSCLGSFLPFSTERNPIWAQKFNHKLLNSDQDLNNAIYYVETNRKKHNLQENPRLDNIISSMLSTIEEAYEIPLTT